MAEAVAEIKVKVQALGFRKLQAIQVLAKIEILEWAQGLRHEFGRVDGYILTKRQMPAQIKEAVAKKLHALRCELALLEKQIEHESSIEGQEKYTKEALLEECQGALDRELGKEVAKISWKDSDHSESDPSTGKEPV